MKRYFITLTQITHKLLITVRLLATQMKITVSSLNVIAHLFHHKQ